jgi:hypothetical protein
MNPILVTNITTMVLVLVGVIVLIALTTIIISYLDNKSTKANYTKKQKDWSDNPPDIGDPLDSDIVMMFDFGRQAYLRNEVIMGSDEIRMPGNRFMSRMFIIGYLAQHALTFPSPPKEDTKKD